MSDMPKILMSSQYDKFKTTGLNRELHTTEKLEQSMKLYGFLPSSPIHVTKSTTPGHFVIVRGHHRFSVAKKLKIPFYYVVDDKCTNISVLETIPKTHWSQGDFVEYYANSGNGNYVFLRDFAKEHMITIGCAANLLNEGINYGRRQIGSRHQEAMDLSIGKFQPKESGVEFAELVMSVIDTFDNAGFSKCRTTAFVTAIAEIIRASKAEPKFRLEHLKKQAKFHIKLNGTIPTRQNYVLALEELYNHKQPETHHISVKSMKIQWARYKKLRSENAAANGKR